MPRLFVGGSTMTITVAVAERRRLVGQLLRNLVAAEPDMETIGPFVDHAQLLIALSERDIDVIVLGIGATPSMELELIARLRSSWPRTQVVTMVTARHEPQLAALARAGATGHISESSDAADVVEVIRASAHGEPSISRELALQLLNEYARPRPTQVELTARERSVLHRIIEGDSNREIATCLGLAEKTVKNHVTSIFDKLGVRDRTQAAVYALQFGLGHDAATSQVDTEGPALVASQGRSRRRSPARRREQTRAPQASRSIA